MKPRGRKRYEFITPEERTRIEEMHREGFSPYEIADVLKRSAQTIYQELRRGRDGSHDYSAKLAQQRVHDGIRRRGYFRSGDSKPDEGQVSIYEKEK